MAIARLGHTPPFTQAWLHFRSAGEKSEWGELGLAAQRYLGFGTDGIASRQTNCSFPRTYSNP